MLFDINTSNTQANYDLETTSVPTILWQEEHTCLISQSSPLYGMLKESRLFSMSLQEAIMVSLSFTCTMRAFADIEQPKLVVFSQALCLPTVGFSMKKAP